MKAFVGVGLRMFANIHSPNQIRNREGNNLSGKLLILMIIETARNMKGGKL